MFVTLITDCDSSNDFGRQENRIIHLFGNVPITPISISFGGTVEAAGNLIDMMNASEGDEGVIMVNAAPRHGQAKKWPNGTPFGYFTYKNTLIVATIDEYCLSLAKKYNVLTEVHVTDIPTVLDEMIKQKRLDPTLRDIIVNSQFRSFDYMPRLTKWLNDGISVPHTTKPVSEIPDIPQCIWLVDGFGNCKTTVFPEEVNHTPGKTLTTKFGEIMCYNRLKDVPNDQPGIIIGSAGFDKKRLLEVVVQGKSAAQKFNLKAGSEIF